MTKRRIHPERRYFWTAAEDRLLREKYPHVQTAKLVPFFPGRTLTTIYQHARNIGLRKTPEYLASPDACRLRKGDNVGWAHRFQKGQVPANKGLRRPGWHRGRMKETQFKKGQRSSRWDVEAYALGALRLSTDGYLFIKATPARSRHSWKLLNRFVWETERGPIPKDHIIRAKNGDQHDTRIENLECITRRENLRRNWHDRYPKSIKQLVQLRGALQRQINKRNGKHERQHDQRPA